MNQTEQRSNSNFYEGILWGTMDILGIEKSVERKIITAALIQFLIPTIFIIGDIFGLFSGIRTIVLSGMFIFMFIALFNTVLIARNDFVNPLKDLTDTARRISKGQIRDTPKINQQDEIKELQEAFKDMTDYLSTAVYQAEKISNEEFDADILKRDLPGRFGEALNEMQDNIQKRITELEESRNNLEKQENELQIILEEIPTPTLVINPDKSIRFYNPAIEELTGISKEDAKDMELYEIFRTDETHDSKKTAMDIVIDKETSIEGEEGPMLTHYDETRQVRIDSAPIYNDEGDLIGGMTNLHDMTGLHKLREEVVQQSEKIEKITETLTDTSSEISNQVVEQENGLEDISKEMQDFSAQMEEIASSAEQVTVSAESAEESVKDGRKSSQDAQKATKDIVEAMENLENTIGKLVNRIEKIENVADVISGIAEETNLLALNASIEAARIEGNDKASNGESSGEGFAVVAKEVKSLAEESQSQSETIRKQIEKIRKQAKNTEKSATNTKKQVDKASNQIQDALSSFGEVADATEEAAEGIAEISKANDQQAQAVEKVVEMTENITEKAKTVRQNTETAQKQTKRLMEVSESLKESTNQLVQ